MQDIRLKRWPAVPVVTAVHWKLLGRPAQPAARRSSDGASAECHHAAAFSCRPRPFQAGSLIVDKNAPNCAAFHRIFRPSTYLLEDEAMKERSKTRGEKPRIHREERLWTGDFQMKYVLIAAMAVVSLAPSTAKAQNSGSIQTGGATASGIVGWTLPHHAPAAYARPVVIGRPLPQSVPVYPVPGQSPYSYTVIGNRRVIVESGSHRIVRVTQ